MLAVIFIFVFIARDAWPFFKSENLREFFTSTRWYPSADKPEFGALAIFAGSIYVTFGAALVAVPLGIAAAVCLSDVIPFAMRQFIKPVIEMLSAIPSVAYGFFSLVVFAPLLQQQGGALLAAAVWIIGLPVAILATIVISDLLSDRLSELKQTNPDSILSIPGGSGGKDRRWTLKISALPLRWFLVFFLGGAAIFALALIAKSLAVLRISSGTNALNVSVILGIMALPTVVSVSEDALQSVGRELREGSYALGATRAETIMKVILPAAGSGILAAVILGVMRAIGETMVVWMASGNSAHIPQPWYNFLEPVRTLTATIAGDMGEADQVTGSARYHVLFAMAFCLLAFCFGGNLVSERIVRRRRKGG